MQLFIRPRLIAALAVILMLASCSKTNKQGKMVPKEAGFVLHIDGKSLSEKINLEELKQMDWYKQLMNELRSDTTGTELMKKLRDNNLSSGIDSLSDFIFFGEKKGVVGMNLVFEGGLRDAKTFENFLKSVYPEGIISKDGDISMMPVKGQALVTWNNERFVVGMQDPGMGSMYSMGEDSVKNEMKDAAFSPVLASYCKKIYSLKDDENLSKDEKFTGLVKTEGDMHLWLNTEKLMNGSPQMGMLNMIKMDKFTTGNISTFTLNFEKGKISVKSKGYAGKELSELFSKYSGGSINTDMIKNIPTKDLVGIFAFHFKPEGVRELIKLTGMDGFIDLMISQQGFTIDDFVKANKGDIMIAITDLSIKRDSTSYRGFDGKMQTNVSEEPTAKFLFAAAIDNKESFNKLIQAAKTALPGNSGNPMSYNSNGSYFALGDSPDYIAKYLAGGNKTEPAYLSKISGNPIGAYVDLQKILQAFHTPSTTDSLGKLMLEESLKIWEDVTLTGGDYSGGGYNQTLEINLVDKNTNSLRQLFQYTMTLAKLENEKRKKLDIDASVSDIQLEEVKKGVPPPPPPVVPAKKK